MRCVEVVVHHENPTLGGGGAGGRVHAGGPSLTVAAPQLAAVELATDPLKGPSGLREKLFQLCGVNRLSVELFAAGVQSAFSQVIVPRKTRNGDDACVLKTRLELELARDHVAF